jgi:transposase
LILDHDNTPTYSSFRVSQFLAGKCISTTGRPPYSPDLAPAGFWLLPELESVLKGKRLLAVEDIKSFLEKKKKHFDRHFCSGF